MDSTMTAVPEQGIVVAIDATPRPLHTVVIEGDGLCEGEAHALVRIWTEADKEACSRCLTCTACPGPMGLDADGLPTRLWICTHGVRGPADFDDRDSIELFSPDGLPA